MRCNQDPVTLNAYLDGALPSEQIAAAREHIGECAACAAELADFVWLQRSLRVARGHFAPSAEFRQKMQSQVAPRRRRPKMMLLISVALATVALLVIFIGGPQYWNRTDTMSEIADLHVNALASVNPLDVVSTDRHTVKPWFQGRIPFSFNVPEFAGTNFTLLGGRLAYVHQQPGAQLIVGMRQHKISVLILRESPELTRAFPLAGIVQNRSSFTVDTWHSEDLRFFVVGDTEPAEIDLLAHALRQANE